MSQVTPGGRGALRPERLGGSEPRAARGSPGHGRPRDSVQTGEVRPERADIWALRVFCHPGFSQDNAHEFTG